MTAKHKCSAKTPNMYGVPNIHPCRRSATVERNGKHYCWQHDPEHVKAETKKRLAVWQAETDREAAKYKHIARNARLGVLVTPELPALLERLARVIDETGIASDVPSVTDEIERAFALAANIREALALEVNECTN